MELSFTTGIIGALGLAGCYYGYYAVKSKIQNYIVAEVMVKLNEKGNNDPISFSELPNNKSGLLRYEQGGKKYSLCVTYDQTKAGSMRGKEVYLISGEQGIEQKTLLTHKPGIPYLLSAKDMGGTKIIVEKRNKIIKEYKDDEVPNYLENTNNKFTE